MRIVLSILFVLLIVPGWSGDPRLQLWGRHPHLSASPVALDPGNPRRTRVGQLEYLGGWHLTSDDAAFGGYSALAVRGDRFTMLSDGGLLLSFGMGRDGVPRDARFGNLPAGPGTGWSKIERDSESLAHDPVSGRWWAGFERANVIIRYDPQFTRGEGAVAPVEMAWWPSNSGAETLVRLRSGRFLAIGEGGLQKDGSGARPALAFLGDPTRGGRSFGWGYNPPAGYRTTDAAELPDGRLVLLNRSVDLTRGWRSKLTLIDLKDIRPGARITGREIATLEKPLVHDNFEGVAVTRERGATILWLVSDDNQSWFQRTLLLKFRLVEGARNATGPRSPKEGGPAKNRR